MVVISLIDKAFQFDELLNHSSVGPRDEPEWDVFWSVLTFEVIQQLLDPERLERRNVTPVGTARQQKFSSDVDAFSLVAENLACYLSKSICRSQMAISSRLIGLISKLVSVSFP